MTHLDSHFILFLPVSPFLAEVQSGCSPHPCGLQSFVPCIFHILQMSERPRRDCWHCREAHNPRSHTRTPHPHSLHPHHVPSCFCVVYVNKQPHCLTIKPLCSVGYFCTCTFTLSLYHKYKCLYSTFNTTFTPALPTAANTTPSPATRMKHTTRLMTQSYSRHFGHQVCLKQERLDSLNQITGPVIQCRKTVYTT